MKRTLSRTIAIRTGHNLLLAAGLATVTVLSLAGQQQTSVERPAAADSARALVAQHQCSSAVPDPTHAVVTVDGVIRYVGKRMTDRAIEQAVFGVDHGLTVHSFCP